MVDSPHLSLKGEDLAKDGERWAKPLDIKMNPLSSDTSSRISSHPPVICFAEKVIWKPWPI